MFFHTGRLQFESTPDKPGPVYAHKLQELIGGAYGEMTVTMQYLFQGWNCRMPGKYKDLIMDVATEEIGHVEMIATMVARLLEGAPNTATTKAAAAGPVVGAVLGGMDPQQAIVAGGGALAADANGYPWNGRYIVASGNLLADFRANAAAEAQGRLQTARLYNMTDDNGCATCCGSIWPATPCARTCGSRRSRNSKPTGWKPPPRRTRCSMRNTPSTPPLSGTCPTAATARTAAGPPAPSPTASTSSTTSPTPSRSAMWPRPRHRTPSCTRPITAPWANPPARRWAPRQGLAGKINDTLS